MLDIRGSINNLKWNTEHHFLHIQAQHDFIRRWAIQFELGYSDFRTIQMALQIDQNMDLLKEFTKAYNAVFQYESVFAEDGLEAFNQKFGDQMEQYNKAHQTLLKILDQLSKLQLAVDKSEENLI